jgi:type I restriction enzyme S subunit
VAKKTNSWNEQKFENCCIIIKGKKPEEIIDTPREGYLQYVSIDSFNNKAKLFAKDKKSPTCDSQDVLMVMDGARSGLVAKGPSGVIGSTLAAIRPKEKVNLNSDFLFYYLKSHYRSLNGKTSGSTIPHVDKRLLKRLIVPLPPLETQNRIVSILERAERLRTLRAEADGLANSFLQSVFLEMFGDLNTTDSFPKVKLKELLESKKGALQSGPFGTHLHNSDFVVNGTVLCVGIDNVSDDGFIVGRNRRITREKYEELSKYKLYPDDVLITIMGSIGRVCVFPSGVGDAICTKHVYRIQVDKDKIKPGFLVASIKFSNLVRDHLWKSKTGQIVDGLTSTSLKGLKIALPPIQKQKKFLEIEEKINRIRTLEAVPRKEINSLFNSLMHRSFQGDL